mmetsp:Transcript_29394/g.53594  ORF Transcript_29394/g.53594 Transcript_29394/m.53594 type:complete len:256 (+) Transcript_29394:502-1269(+)
MIMVNTTIVHISAIVDLSTVLSNMRSSVKADAALNVRKILSTLSSRSILADARFIRFSVSRSLEKTTSNRVEMTMNASKAPSASETAYHPKAQNLTSNSIVNHVVKKSSITSMTSKLFLVTPALESSPNFSPASSPSISIRTTMVKTLASNTAVHTISNFCDITADRSGLVQRQPALTLAPAAGLMLMTGWWSSISACPISLDSSVSLLSTPVLLRAFFLRRFGKPSPTTFSAPLPRLEHMSALDSVPEAPDGSL